MFHSESLESRRLLASASLSGTGTLNVLGNDSADNAEFEFFAVANRKLRVTINGTEREFERKNIKRISIDLKGGSDTADLQAFQVGGITGDGFAVPVTLLAGAGNDNVVVSGSSMEIDPGGGNDNIRVPNSTTARFKSSLGDDTLTGGVGNEIFETGDVPDGRDVMIGGSGGDSVSYSGRANAVVMYANGTPISGEAGEGDSIDAEMDSLTGGDGNDTITGASGRNSLNGRGGEDLLNGRKGKDTLIGGTGYDTVEYFTSDGTEGVFAIINGEPVSGRPGESDTIELSVENIIGTSRADTLLGNGGMNVLTGNGGEDSLRGEGGADTLSLNGAGTVSGGGGNDTILGSGRGDVLFGDGGNDSISGNGAADTINGGLGDDFIDGGAGADLLGAFPKFQVSGLASDAFESGNDTILGGLDNDIVTADLGADSVEAGGGDDQVDGGPGGDTLAGNDGNDSISGGDDADTLRGGEGNDNLGGERASGFSAVGAGNVLPADDFVEGNAGDDVLFEVGGNNRMFGGSGNDRIFAGGGTDLIEAQDGNDFIAAGLGTDTVKGGAGSDFISYGDSGRAAGVNVSLDGVINDGGPGENDVLTEIENIEGSVFGDTIAGSSGANQINGGPQSLVSAADGGDSITGSAGNDTINAGLGNDTVDGGSGDDSVAGGAGNDTLSGKDGADTLDGGAGDDLIDGGNGTDSIVGGEGSNQILNPQNGNDVVSAGSPTPQAPNGSVDKGVVFDGTNDDDVIRIDRVETASGPQVVFTTDRGVFTAFLTNCNTIFVNGRGGDDLIVMSESAGAVWKAVFNGGDGNDTLIGTQHNDRLRGDGGDDLLIGRGGRDDLLGGDGEDELVE